ncbi:MAG: excinuclease ABC subunit UvrA [Terriglobales bacterium]
MPPAIEIRGARVHNLKQLDASLPLNQLIVITGVSGSGKSSLAFDTLYAEGQRRYVESLSAYARQFLERMERPDVDSIDGIAPAVAIRQKSGSRNPRSTVGTVTEIYDYLRLLFARVGVIMCPDCDLPAGRSDVDTAVAALLAEAAGARALVLFPVGASGEAEALKTRLAELRAKGFNRLWQAGTTVEFSTPESLLELDLNQPIAVLLDRLVIEPDARARLVDAIEIAYREGGEVRLLEAGGARQWRFSPRFECRRCARGFETPEPALFSFNNPFGACPRCQGFGNVADISEALVVPNGSLSLGEGAIELWTRPRWQKWARAMERYAAAAGIPLDVAWGELSPAQREAIWRGGGKFPGVEGFFERLERKKYKVHVRVLISRYRGFTLCPACGGARLRPEALWVRLSDTEGGRRNIADVVGMTIAGAQAWFERLQLDRQQQAIAPAVLTEVRQRLGFLLKVGLEYLTLDRLAATLSGGEAQRIQLATCLGAQLVGSLYVLDEPSIGLHPRDTARLIGILRELRDLGNTIVVVEHDPEVMRASDYLLDLGPAAGELGGEVVAAGPWREVERAPRSLTGAYLRGERQVPRPLRRREPGPRELRLEGVNAHNLHDLDATIPLGVLVAITGVSGSGKSTLIHDVLFGNLRRLLRSGPEAEPGGGARGASCRRLEGWEHLSDVVLVDQSPIGRSPRSNPVTYMKAFDGIRLLFAAQSDARRRGLRPSHFSFNLPGGRCEACQGDGVVTVEMQFLADVELPCEECGGRRFQAKVLDITFQDRNIHQVLRMSVLEGLAFFRQHPRITRPLQLLEEIGLGYLRLGQSATTLSGGEAQRLKLAAHLAQPRTAARTLFLFDEPTTGLHFDDIARLLAALERLLDAGGSVVVIEHNLDVIQAADWVIDLGPEGGAGGGRIVAAGPPELVACAAHSHTAAYLAARLQAAPAPAAE